MSEVEIMYECQVCYKLHGESKLIAVEAIKNNVLHRVYPWLICYGCAENISEALKANGKEEEKPLTEMQKKYISLFKGEEYGECTDGYLMTKLGIFDWKEAEKLIAQYEREGKNE